MLDFNAPEFLIVGIVALLVIGPKDLPKAMRFVGKWVGKGRRIANQFRSGLDNMVRESELAELEKKWAEENARIMREHPPERFLNPPDEAIDPTVNAPSAPVKSWDQADEQPVTTTPAPDIRPDPAPVAQSPDTQPADTQGAAPNGQTPESPIVDGKPQS